MRALALLLLAGCSNLPDKWTLTSSGITVEVTRAPYSYVIVDGSGKTVLGTAKNGAADGYGALGWVTGRTEWAPIATKGYYQFDTVFDKWRDSHEVTDAKKVGADRLEVTLDDGTKVVHQLRASTLRVEASRSDKPRAWSAAFQTPSDEAFIGFGERYNLVNQRGHSMFSWMEEGGLAKGEPEKASPTNPYPNGEGMTYYPVPFMLSTAGYGFWLDSTWRNQFDLASDKADRWRVWHIGPTIAYEVYVPIANDTRPWPLTVVDLFTATTGRPMMPVKWSFGPRRRINREGMVNGVPEVQAMRDEGLAITASDDTLHFLPGGNLPPQAELTPWLALQKQLGYKPVCYFNSLVSTNPSDAIAPAAQMALANHWFLEGPDGPSVVFLLSGGAQNVWQVDVSNPDAVNWFTSLFTPALDMGYRGWMYDFGEYVQPEIVAHNGMTGEEFHNLYPVLYDKAAHDFLEASPYKDDWFYFSRSGYTGAQKYAPMVWSGDPDASFDDAEGLPAQVRAGINIGISGVANWGSDIGGYKCQADLGAGANGELLARWIEAGSMNSNMHDEDACSGGSGKATIWTSDDAKTAWRVYAKLHTRMAPYMWSLAKEATRTGAPLIQSLFLQHPEARFAPVEDAHYFGPSLLVAPVVARGAVTKAITLPDGKWLEWQPDGSVAEIREGAVTLDAPLTKLPLLLRDGHLLPLLDPTIDTLAEGPHAGIIGPEDVAGVYDAVGFLTRGQASFTVDDGDLSASWDGTLDLSSVPSASQQVLTGMKHVLISASGDVTAGGLKLHSSTGRMIRWDLYLGD